MYAKFFSQSKFKKNTKFKSNGLHDCENPTSMSVPIIKAFEVTKGLTIEKIVKRIILELCK